MICGWLLGVFFRTWYHMLPLWHRGGSKGGPGSILGGISVSFGSHFESLGVHLRSFSVCFLSFVSSLFSEVFFSGPGQTLNGFGMHSGVRWELFSLIWMTFAGSGDPLFLNNTMVV